jgi:hypothetical protein
MSKGLQIALGGIAVAALLGWYAASNLEEIGTFRYYQTLAEFRADPGDGAAARVHGYVEPGSIVRDVATRELRFEVVNDPPRTVSPSSTPRSRSPTCSRTGPRWWSRDGSTATPSSWPTT